MLVIVYAVHALAYHPIPRHCVYRLIYLCTYNHILSSSSQLDFVSALPLRLFGTKASIADRLSISNCICRACTRLPYYFDPPAAAPALSYSAAKQAASQSSQQTTHSRQASSASGHVNYM